MRTSKMSPTPCAQEDKLVETGWLISKSCRYKVQSILGEGTFGKVAKCTTFDDSKTVAIKMVKKMNDQAEHAYAEVAILEKLKSLNADKCNLVQWNQVFNSKGYICLEFELLDKSLYDFMKARFFRPLFLKESRPIIQQLANALEHLKTVRLIHADLKLENVMLVNHNQQPFRVKVIDFGLACEVSNAKVCSYIQSRPYRSPEIILGLPFTEAIDMWSLGCIAATLYIGTLLYPGNSSYDVMRYIVETQGQPPDQLLTRGYNTTHFFQRSHQCGSSVWKLKTHEQIYKDTKIQSQENRRLKLTSLDNILHLRMINTANYADKAAEMVDTLMFLDMLKGMLHLDAAKRITPRQVLDHPFITMRHIDSMYPLSYHVRSCFKSMEAVRNNNPRGKDRCPSPRQPHCSTAGLVRLQCNNQHPCSSNQMTPSDRSGKKRKVDDEDEDVKKTSHQSKIIKSAFDSSKNSRLTSCFSNDQRCADSTRTRLNKSTQTQSWIISSHKRRMADDECEISKTHRYERSDYERKRFREIPKHRQSSSCSSKTPICVSPRVKRKMAQDEDSERSHNEEKMARIRHTYRSTHSSRYYSAPYSEHGRRHERHRHITPPSCSTQTKSEAQSNKRKAPDEDVQPRKRHVFSGGIESPKLT